MPRVQLEYLVQTTPWLLEIGDFASLLAQSFICKVKFSTTAIEVASMIFQSIIAETKKKNPQKSHSLHRHIFEIHGVKYRKSITNVLGTSNERMKARHKNVIKI